jgi:hypothetical protein
MPDNDDCNERAKQAMKQVETPLNQSGGAAQKVSRTAGQPSTRQSLNIHCDHSKK